MQIIVDQEEIVQAIKDYVGKQGIAIENKNLEVALTAGSSPAGHSASVDISDREELTGNQPMDNFKLPSKADQDTKEDLTEVNQILDAELAKDEKKASKKKDKPAPEKAEKPEPIEEEDSPFGEDNDETPTEDLGEAVTEGAEEDDDVDSLFGS